MKKFSLPVLATFSFLSLAACSGAQPAPETPPEPAKTKVSTQDPRYLSLPKPGPVPDWTPPTATKTELNNQLTVWRMDQGTTPLVSIHLMLPVGTAQDPKGKEGLTLLTADLLDEGAGKYDALGLSDKLGELATSYGSSAGIDYTLLSMDALSENLEESLALLADIVRRPKLTKKEFERRKKHHLATALTAKDDPGTSRSKALAHVLFGEGYAGRSPAGTMASLERITWQDVKKHARALSVPEGAHLVVAGMTDEKSLVEAIEKSFASWSGKSQLEVPPVEKQEALGRAFVIDFPGATQSSLAIATRAGSDEDPNYFAEEVMNQKLGQSFTGRINMNLREDKGYTYGARGGFRRHQSAGYFSITTNVKTETTGASITEIFKEFSDLCGDRPLTEQERNESVEGLLLGYPMRFDQVSSMGIRLVQLPVHKRAVDFWSTWPAKVKQITTARANEAATPYCKSSRYSIVIAGDKKTVVPQLEALKLEIVLLDRDGLVIEKDEASSNEK